MNCYKINNNAIKMFAFLLVILVVLFIYSSKRNNYIFNEKSVNHHKLKNINSITNKELIWDIFTLEKHLLSPIGKSCTININRTVNQPTICYLDQLVHQVKYAIFDGCDWETRIIDKNVKVNRNDLSFSFDTLNNPHFVYNYSTENKGLETIKHVTLVDNQLVYNYSPYFSRITSNSSLASAINKLQYILYMDFDTSKLCIATIDNGEYFTEKVDDVELDIYKSVSSLKLKGGLIQCVSFYDNVRNILYYSFKSDGKWNKDVVDKSLNGCRLMSLNFNNKSEPVIQYLDQQYTLKTAIKKNKSWIIQSVAKNVSWNSSVMFDSHDNPRLVYSTRNYPTSTTNNLIYLFKENYKSSFRKSVISNIKNVMYISLVLDNNDIPHICFVDLEDSSLKYATLKNN